MDVSPSALDARHPVPPEEDGARRLHESLTRHHTLALVAERRGLEESFEDRALRLLHLQDQGILAVAAVEEDHQHRTPTLPTPTTLHAMSATWNCASSCRRS